ncbi:MAG TPA: cbb3-type cytochrome c oxidase N-terminal domain-containing protein [Bdellovibrionales bacterium]|nr:cbb3-type cytochrome c oxidase N-terminal domain-containing protein [Bdellovibrionales bacterium]
MSDQDKTTEVLKGDEGLLLDHNYDGIKELDYPLPRWWLILFYVSIVFAVGYAGYYMLGFGPTLTQELAIDLQQISEAQAKAPKPESQGDEVFAVALKDPKQVQLGHDSFSAKCAACHGDVGQGLIGPNLTDDYWLHGNGSLQAIAKVVAEGVPEKGMPAWAAIVKSDELVHLVAFIKSLRGTNPPAAKEPQGERQEL